MSEPRFFVSRSSVDRARGTVTVTDTGLCAQIRKVLRLSAGDRVSFLDGEGGHYICRLDAGRSGRLSAEIIEVREATGDLPLHLEVALPLIKGDRFEWAVQKLTELGASKVVPLVSERTVARSKSDARLARWQSIAREAAEQCERATVPPVVMPVELADYWQSRAGREASRLDIVCAERRDVPTLERILHSREIAGAPPTDISVTIGPEGGFSDTELDQASRLGLTMVSLGPRILRAETAAVAAACQIAAIFSDTRGSERRPEGA